MNTLRVTFAGAQQLMPERYTALVLTTDDRRWVIPIWVSPAKADYCTALRLGIDPKRPNIYELFAELVRKNEVELEKVHIHGYEEGVFFTSLVCRNGMEYQILPSDAILLAESQALPIEIDEPVFEQCKVYVGDDVESVDELFTLRGGIICDPDDTARLAILEELAEREQAERLRRNDPSELRNSPTSRNLLQKFSRTLNIAPEIEEQ